MAFPRVTKAKASPPTWRAPTRWVPSLPMSKRTTLADVAREAGVSVQTASHVLADNRTVRLPEATRERVRAAAQRVGYRPNRLAQAMRRGKTGLVGVWMPVDRPTPTYQRFLQAISARAREGGVELLITGLDSSMAYGAEGKAPTAWPVDGLIALDAGRAMTRFREDPANDGTPLAIIGLEQFANSDSVAWDLLGGAREAVARMIRAGARRPVHVTPRWVFDGYLREQRRRGYTEAVLEAGLEPRFVVVDGETSRDAEAAMRNEDIPDAVFGFNDTYAIGAARAVLAAGAKIPDDCLVWGFGDYPEGPDFRVPISTLGVPLEAVLDRAWSWLMERIEIPSLPPRLELIPMDIIERDSSRRQA